MPYTWQIWEDNNMKYDSTLCYADNAGFRCGTCYEFSVFNILKRKKLELKEMPLIIMDATLVNYQGLSPLQSLTKITSILDRVKRYSGQFVILWHNSNLNCKPWMEYQKIYKNLLNSF